MIRPTVLVVVPCLNEEQHIERVVRTLLDQVADDAQLVVADGGSTDRTRLIVSQVALRDRRVTLQDNPARLQSAGVNAAAREFAGRFQWLVRADAHADYPPEFVATLVQEALSTGADSVVTSMVTTGASCFTRAAAAAQNSGLGTGGARHRRRGEGQWVEHGHHSLFRLDAFKEVGGYDATFSHNEDAELDVRLSKAGHRIWLTGKTHVVYHPRRDPFALVRQYRNHGAGRARTLLKHQLRPRARQIAPALVAPALVLALLAPLHLLFAAPIVAWTALCLGSGCLLAIRAADLCLVGSGPVGMLMHASWSTGFWLAVLRRRSR